MLVGRAPLRISFSGGGTDLEEYHKKYDGYSVSYTINSYTYVIAKLRRDDKLQGFSPDFASHLTPKKYSSTKILQGHEIIIVGLEYMKFKKGIDMYLTSDVEPNSGLGASSSLTTNFVNVISYLQGKKRNPNEIAMKAYKIGHDILKWGIGKQDEFAAAFGGLNLYKYSKDKVSVKPINLKKSTLKELQERSLLFHLGDREHSKGILQSQINAINKSKKITLSSLHKAKELALEMHDALKEDDLTKFSDILNRGWKAKQGYTKGVSNPRIDKISKKAIEKGAEALKVTGAGGGGHFFVVANPSKHKSIINSLKKLGVHNVQFKYQNEGSKVFEINNL
ncbi:Mevalonate kinase protein [Marine Group I thaumarchaeote SCGC AAA799-P11]|uniref:Mevalonate kinase protein n=1 Tax=Marine Group I thaumarchaeote SCGC AAA799-P11 TaxID=1502295 RepID=A0A087S2Y2_9ARCH|nr:Mevalonate kinase protein [Marine Group I thaumarchaeote SCGC AAA799-P11]